jgi:hypothetical protein
VEWGWKGVTVRDYVVRREKQVNQIREWLLLRIAEQRICGWKWG